MIMGAEEGTRDMMWEEIEEGADKLRVKGGTPAQILVRTGALASGAPRDDFGQPTNKAAVDWLIMGAEEDTRDMTWEEIEEEADKLRVKGGTAAQIVVRAGALASGAPRDDFSQPTNKAAVDWLIMGAEEGTREMMWEEIEEGADKLRVKGGTAAQITARAGAAKHGAPADALGLASSLDAVNYALNGAEEGCRGKMQEQVTEGAVKKRKEGGDICKTAASRKRKREGGLRGGDAQKVASLARGQDDRHSHSCILPECRMFCTLKPRGGGGQRTPFASATCARSPKKLYTVSASIYVAIVTKQPHSARRRYAPISLAHDRRNFASIFTPRKMR